MNWKKRFNEPKIGDVIRLTDYDIGYSDYFSHRNESGIITDIEEDYEDICDHTGYNNKYTIEWDNQDTSRVSKENMVVIK